ncbi:MAG TPA: SIS domain-containing protein [Dongiaceae bacterium]|nr:SIS domain-containing protein [Dongiaceae bacterium]
MQIGAYIREQPKTLAELPSKTAAALAGFRSLARKPERIVLVGTGSSMNALLCAADAFEELTGATVLAKEPEAFLRLPPRPNGQHTLVVVASQSGTSLTPVEAARRALASGFSVIAVTGDGASALAKTGADVLVMPIGTETVGPKTKGYTATVLSLFAIAAKLGSRALDPSALVKPLEATVETGLAAAKDLLARYGVPDYILMAGQSQHLGSALESGLKIAEISGVPTAGFDTEEALHGHSYGTTKQSLVVMIAQNEAEAKVAANLGEALTPLGPRLVIANLSRHATRFDLEVDWPKAPELDWVAASWAPIPFQWYACELAVARGIDPDKMIYPGLGDKLNVRPPKPKA